MKQNVTLRLDKDLIRKAKVLAAQQGTSLSGLLTRQLEEVVRKEHAYTRARAMALAFLTRGFPLGGKVVARDEWHAR